jgi:hypothetical protein
MTQASNLAKGGSNFNSTGNLSLTTGVTGTLPVANGGTGGTTSTGSGALVLATSPTLVTPVLGTPSSGTLTNCTFPTLNQNTTGTAAGLSATLAIASGGTNSTATATAGGIGYGTGTAHAYTAAGTSGQVLQSNGSSAPSWGAVTLPAGTVKQVVQTTNTAAFTTTSTSYVTFMTVSITPSSTSSKILITYGTNGGTGGDVAHGYLAIFRDSTQLFKGDAAGSRTGATNVINTATQQQMAYGGTFLDSPATTSAISYTIRILSSNGQQISLNRSNRDTDRADYDGRSASSVTVMEISA